MSVAAADDAVEWARNALAVRAAGEGRGHGHGGSRCPQEGSQILQKPGKKEGLSFSYTMYIHTSTYISHSPVRLERLARNVVAGSYPWPVRVPHLTPGVGLFRRQDPSCANLTTKPSARLKLKLRRKRHNRTKSG